MKPIEHLDHDEAVRRGRIGGLKKAENERKRKTFNELCNMFAEGKVTNEALKKKMQQDFKLDDEQLTNKMAMVIGLWNKAVAGDVRAFEAFRDTVGEKPKEEIEYSEKKVNPFEGLSTEELRDIIDNNKSE